MAQLQSFHHGDALGLLERACLSSFRAHGHDVVLHVYNEVDAPPGVELADAACIIGHAEKDAFFAQAPGRVSQFSNGFRYRMLSRNGGWWVDTDVLCLSRDLPASDIVMGWASDEHKPNRRIGSSILRFPRDHDLPARAANAWRQMWDRAEWGVTGPRLVTALAEELDLLDRVAPFGTLYRIAWDQALTLFDPGARGETTDLLRGSSLLHLANSGLGFLGLARNILPPEGSFLRPLIVPFLSAAEIESGDAAYAAALTKATREAQAELARGRQRQTSAAIDRRRPTSDRG